MRFILVSEPFQQSNFRVNASLLDFWSPARLVGIFNFSICKYIYCIYTVYTFSLSLPLWLSYIHISPSYTAFTHLQKFVNFSKARDKRLECEYSLYLFCISSFRQHVFHRWCPEYKCITDGGKYVSQVAQWSSQYSQLTWTLPAVQWSVQGVQ